MKVYIVKHEYPNGENLYAFDTEAKAVACLREIVFDWYKENEHLFDEEPRYTEIANSMFEDEEYVNIIELDVN